MLIEDVFVWDSDFFMRPMTICYVEEERDFDDMMERAKQTVENWERQEQIKEIKFF